MSERMSRRRMIASLGAGAGGLLLGGCDRVAASAAFRAADRAAQDLTQGAQRLITHPQALAREFTLADLSPVFRVNGNAMPRAPAYQALLANGFADWRLRVDGLVGRPLAVSLDQLRRLPQRSQITRHDCVEGWSAIGQWTGPQLSLLLDAAGLRPEARYIVFHCADDFNGWPYYESIDLVDAFHPQTILALALNRRPLPVGNGAPVRLRVERQLGYKHAKFVMRIEAVASFADIHRGQGGYWEDAAGYQWYAGI